MGKDAAAGGSNVLHPPTATIPIGQREREAVNMFPQAVCLPGPRIGETREGGLVPGHKTNLFHPDLPDQHQNDHIWVTESSHQPQGMFFHGLPLSEIPSVEDASLDDGLWKDCFSWKERGILHSSFIVLLIYSTCSKAKSQSTTQDTRNVTSLYFL